MTEILRGLHVLVYDDPVQVWLRDVETSLLSADGLTPESRAASRFLQAQALRRLRALPVDVAGLQALVLEAATSLCGASGYESVCDQMLDTAADLPGEARVVLDDHPLGRLSVTGSAVSHLLPHNASDMFAQEASYLVGHEDEVLTVSELRRRYSSPRRTSVPDLLSRRSEAPNPRVRMYGWPNLYYTYPWFEPHAWLWLLASAEVLSPRTAPRCLDWELWKRSAHHDWAQTQNREVGRLLRPLLSAESARVDEGPLPPDPWQLEPGKWLQHEAQNWKVLFKDGLMSREERGVVTYLWDPESGHLTCSTQLYRHIRPGGDATLVVRLKENLHEILGSHKSQVEIQAEAWRSAAASALAAEDFRHFTRAELCRVATGAQMRFTRPGKVELLYQTLRRHGSVRFTEVLPTQDSARKFLRKWHGEQSQGGRSGVQELEELLAAGGWDEAVAADLIEVVHAHDVQLLHVDQTNSRPAAKQHDLPAQRLHLTTESTPPTLDSPPEALNDV